MTGNGKFDLGPSFGERVQTIVSHRGLRAERELIEVIGLARLMAIYDGADPTFPEAVEIARILYVPLSSFAIIDLGSFPELEIAWAELLYASALLGRDRRADVVDHVTKLAHGLQSGEADEIFARLDADRNGRRRRM